LAVLDKIVWGALILSGAGLAYFVANPTPDQPLSLEEISGEVRRVVDGDSLYIGGYEPQIRLWGVDAPERTEPGYSAATRTLSDMTLAKQITCRRVNTDRYERTVARCFLKDGSEVNRTMIESGTATEYMRFSKGFYTGG
jgi:endonuclease YncB( thermonuclease family)